MGACISQCCFLIIQYVYVYIIICMLLYWAFKSPSMIQSISVIVSPNQIYYQTGKSVLYFSIRTADKDQLHSTDQFLDLPQHEIWIRESGSWTEFYKHYLVLLKVPDIEVSMNVELEYRIRMRP